MSDVKRQEIFGVLVTKLGRQGETERRTVPAIERLVVHLVAEQRLWLKSGFDIERFVIAIRTGHGEKARATVGADHGEEIADAGAAEPADDIPPLDADVPDVLCHLRQRSNLIE